MRFGSRDPTEQVPVRLRKRHRSELTEKAWENSVRGLRKEKPIKINPSHVQKIAKLIS